MATGSSSQHGINNDNKYTRWTIAQTQRSTTGWTPGRIQPRRNPCLESSPTTMSCFLVCQRSQGKFLGTILVILKWCLAQIRLSCFWIYVCWSKRNYKMIYEGPGWKSRIWSKWILFQRLHQEPAKLRRNPKGISVFLTAMKSFWLMCGGILETCI